MAASKHVNTLPQCIPASVGLAQARPGGWGNQHHHLVLVERGRGLLFDSRCS